MDKFAAPLVVLWYFLARDVLTVGTTSCQGQADSMPWKYASSHEWGGSCADGRAQSPVNVPRTGNVVSDLSPVQFSDYGSSASHMRVSNEAGKAVVITLSDGCGDEESGGRVPRISLGNSSNNNSSSNASFVFYKAAFHWPSEHTKSGTVFPLEVHLYHYNDVEYASPGHAAGRADGIAVLTTLFQTTVDHNLRLEALFALVPGLSSPGSHAEVAEPPPLFYFVPKVKDAFYRYSGSLTTPPCSEEASWTVFRDTIPISLKQLSYFQRLIPPELKEEEKKGRGLSNRRPLQELNGRLIHERRGAGDDGGEGGEAGAEASSSKRRLLLSSSYWLYIAVSLVQIISIIPS